MILLRLAGAALLALSGAVAARVINSADMSSLRQTEGFISFIRICRVQIDCFSLPISEILQGCGKSELFACGYEKEGAPSDMSEFVCGCRVSDVDACELFFSFASEFGRGYRAEQLKACDYYISMLEERRKKLSAILPLKRKRNATLCICASLALAIASL